MAKINFKYLFGEFIHERFQTKDGFGLVKREFEKENKKKNGHEKPNRTFQISIHDFSNFIFVAWLSSAEHEYFVQENFILKSLSYRDPCRAFRQFQS